MTLVQEKLKDLHETLEELRKDRAEKQLQVEGLEKQIDDLDRTITALEPALRRLKLADVQTLSFDIEETLEQSNKTVKPLINGNGKSPVAEPVRVQ